MVVGERGNVWREARWEKLRNWLASSVSKQKVKRKEFDRWFLDSLVDFMVLGW